QTMPAPETATPGNANGRLASSKITPDTEALDGAISEIAKAKRPLIIVGYGARKPMDSIIKLAEYLRCPVVTTFKGKGQMPDSHSLAAGVLGRSGTPIASWFMNECDLKVVLGASFSNHTGIEKSKRTIQVNFEQMALGKLHPVDFPTWGEIDISVQLMLKKLTQVPQTITAVDQSEELAQRWKLWREEKVSRGQGLNSARLFRSLSNLLPAKAIIAVDVSNNTYSFGRYVETKAGQRALMSGCLRSIGFSFPAATQAEPEFKGRPVFSISGDVGFGQYLADFTTAVKYKMNITHILLNNNELGKISKEQMAGKCGRPLW
ncbi:MAG: pyruvate oxidase, partial [Cellvibrionaceae bacterium]